MPKKVEGGRANRQKTLDEDQVEHGKQALKEILKLKDHQLAAVMHLFPPHVLKRILCAIEETRVVKNDSYRQTAMIENDFVETLIGDTLVIRPRR
ncbi:hypothetical protein A2841_01575 [Candidatus Kaiserbacteria bacterium RIFCSPHIGHO2_01_FULL_48_10]|uniref:Uncharacterized protein n=1 Tax=Candidatus Kaiserbacteria bacterium RIFCSPHIGHO2_01_FULL_48_10 TaxID=1798476 RepID=A0A1F6C3U2_9BACT|nr:MAG: hypothetical protein A2841_01575 [Candidatus Kaiserbacteria bacterium RIFCSPHIGHO2_01_FULL_48_10]